MTLGQKQFTTRDLSHPVESIYAHGRATGALLLPRASAAARPGALECAFSAPRAQLGSRRDPPDGANPRAPARMRRRGAL